MHLHLVLVPVTTLILYEKFLPYIPVLYFLNFTWTEVPPQNPILFAHYKKVTMCDCWQLSPKIRALPFETHPQTEALLSAQPPTLHSLPSNSLIF